MYFCACGTCRFCTDPVYREEIIGRDSPKDYRRIYGHDYDGPPQPQYHEQMARQSKVFKWMYDRNGKYDDEPQTELEREELRHATLVQKQYGYFVNGEQDNSVQTYLKMGEAAKKRTKLYEDAIGDNGQWRDHVNETCSSCDKPIDFTEWFCYCSLCPDCYLKSDEHELPQETTAE